MNEILGTVEMGEYIPTQGDPLSHIQFDNSHFTIGTKVEKVYISKFLRNIKQTHAVV